MQGFDQLVVGAARIAVVFLFALTLSCRVNSLPNTDDIQGTAFNRHRGHYYPGQRHHLLDRRKTDNTDLVAFEKDDRAVSDTDCQAGQTQERTAAHSQRLRHSIPGWFGRRQEQPLQRPDINVQAWQVRCEVGLMLADHNLKPVDFLSD